MNTKIFTSYKAISASVGKTNGIHLVNDDRDLPYIEVNGVYHYFGQVMDAPHPAFRLVMTSSKDIEAKGEQE